MTAFIPSVDCIGQVPVNLNGNGSNQIIRDLEIVAKGRFSGSVNGKGTSLTTTTGISSHPDLESTLNHHNGEYHGTVSGNGYGANRQSGRLTERTRSVSSDSSYSQIYTLTPKSLGEREFRKLSGMLGHKGGRINKIRVYENNDELLFEISTNPNKKSSVKRMSSRKAEKYLSSILTEDITDNKNTPTVDADNPDSSKKVIIAKRTDKAPVIDGIPESLWNNAEVYSGFTNLLPPAQGDTTKDQTHVRVMHDGKYMYFLAICDDSNYKWRQARSSTRDQMAGDDNLMFVLDRGHSDIKAFYFGINPRGTQLDGIVEGASNDASWDENTWIARSRGDNNLWTVEARIPLSLFGTVSGDSLFGFNAIRHHNRGDRTSALIFTGGNEFQLENYSVLVLEDLGTERRSWSLGIVPSLVLRAGDRGENMPDKMIRYWEKTKLGLDNVMFISPNLRAYFTWSPDDAIVESDKHVTRNLLNWEIAYDERRPFFLWDSPRYKTPFFYTRRASDVETGLKIAGEYGNSYFGLMNIVSASDFAGERANYSVFKGFQKFPLIGITPSQVGMVVVSRDYDGNFDRVAALNCLLKHGNHKLAGEVAKSFVSGQNLKNNYNASTNLRIEGPGVYFIELRGKYIGKDFKPVTGYYPEVGLKGGDVLLNYVFSFDKAVLKYLALHSNFSRTFLTDNEKLSSYNHLETSFKTREGRLWSKINHNWEDRLVGDKMTKSHAYFFSLAGKVTPKITADAAVNIGQQYDHETLDLSFNLDPQLGKRITLSLGAEYNTTEYSDRADIDRVFKLMSSSEILKEHIFLRTYMLFSSQTEKLTANGRAEWRFNPGNSLYLLVTNTTDTHDMHIVTSPEDRWNTRNLPDIDIKAGDPSTQFLLKGTYQFNF